MATRKKKEETVEEVEATVEEVIEERDMSIAAQLKSQHKINENLRKK